MLQQTVGHAIRQYAAPSIPKTCLTCTCCCGRRFALSNVRSPAVTTTVAKRHRYSPAVRNVNRNMKSYVSPDDAMIMSDRRYSYELSRWDKEIDEAIKSGDLGSDIKKYEDFMSAVLDPKVNAMTSERLKSKQRELGMSDSECTVVLHSMLIYPHPLARKRGRDGMHIQSSCGVYAATMLIVKNAVEAHKLDRVTLKKSTLVQPLAHLQKLASFDTNVEAMVLLGNVHYQLGHKDDAVGLYKRAMRPAIDLAKRATEQTRIQQGPFHRRLSLEQSVKADLQSPWIELTNIYTANRDLEGLDQAVKIGIHVDDPLSHFEKAQSLKPPGAYIGESSDWLFHITKAASSGHAMAAHELGLYYANSGWKYVEDEPPDMAKPTPFDSYPAAKNMMLSRFWSRLLAAVGFVSPESSSIFRHAAFPATPKQRMALALQWLEVSMGLLYAPSYLLTAQLLLEKTLWGMSNMPKNARDLSYKRYKYASVDDYRLGDRIAGWQEVQPRPDVPNPYYDEERAKAMLREVLYAAAARSTYEDQAAVLRKSGKRTADTASLTPDETVVAQSMPGELSKWFTFPDVRAMYTDPSTGLLSDPTRRMSDLRATACKICDKHGWYLANPTGGLIYRPRT